MPTEGMPTQLRRHRAALFALFGLPGFTIASWVSRTPDIRNQINATTVQMGLVLFGVSVGAMLGILVSTPMIGRFGARGVTGVGMSCVVTSMPIVGLGAGLGMGGVVAVGLCMFGIGMGGCEIAINSEAATVERATGGSLLPAMHGCFSLGTVVGSLAGVGCTYTGVPVGAHLVTVGLAGMPVLASQVRHLSPHTGRTPHGDNRRSSHSPGARLWRERQLLFIGLIVLAMALAEGAATDWLPLVMVDGHGTSSAVGSTVFAAFSAAMAFGRFGGGYFVNLLGRATVFRLSAATAAVGIACIALVDNHVVAAAAVVLWGLGLSLGFPVAISAAGDSGADSVQRVSLVATMGYLAFLVGPPFLGVLGEAIGLRHALLAPLTLVVLVAFLAPALEPPA